MAHRLPAAIIIITADGKPALLRSQGPFQVDMGKTLQTCICTRGCETLGLSVQFIMDTRKKELPSPLGCEHAYIVSRMVTLPTAQQLLSSQPRKQCGPVQLQCPRILQLTCKSRPGPRAWSRGDGHSLQDTHFCSPATHCHAHLRMPGLWARSCGAEGNQTQKRISQADCNV